jgi:hypothetical protein
LDPNNSSLDESRIVEGNAAAPERTTLMTAKEAVRYSIFTIAEE